MRYGGYRWNSGYGRSMGIWRLTPAIKWIMIFSFAVYVVELITFNWLRTDRMVVHLSIIPARTIFALELWQPLTFMWLHDPRSPGHIILNMFGLWMFGTLLEDRWGSINFIKFYILTGFLSGVAVLLAGFVTGHIQTITLGASGAIYAIVIAFGVIFPNLNVYFLGLLPIKAKWLVYATIGGTVLFYLARTPSISISAHIGGMVAGALIVTGWWRPRRFLNGVKEIYFRFRMKRKLRPPPHDDDDNVTPLYH